MFRSIHCRASVPRPLRIFKSMLSYKEKKCCVIHNRNPYNLTHISISSCYSVLGQGLAPFTEANLHAGFPCVFRAEYGWEKLTDKPFVTYATWMWTAAHIHIHLKKACMLRLISQTAFRDAFFTARCYFKVYIEINNTLCAKCFGLCRFGVSGVFVLGMAFFR